MKKYVEVTCSIETAKKAARYLGTSRKGDLCAFANELEMAARNQEEENRKSEERRIAIEERQNAKEKEKEA